jgi:pyruvate, water dikinase
MEPRFTAWFESLRLSDRPSVGGKCANLGELVSAGIPVPNGFAVTVEAFEAFEELNNLREHIRAGLIDQVDVTNSAALRQVQKEASALIHAGSMPERLEREVHEGYAELCRLAARSDLPVAVRSSAVAEDGDASSFAGQQETYLWVVGAEDVVMAIRDCWASLFTPQAVAYRENLDEDRRRGATRISVAVQEMVDAKVSGVAFTVSPRTGDPSVVAVNASWGLGEAVVAGEVTPDEYWLTKVGPALTSSTISRKLHQCVPAAGGKGTQMVDVPEHLVEVACLDEALVVELASLAIKVEKHYKSPQDIEWALAADSDGQHRFMLLQSRPETAHKHAKAARKAAPASGAASYLSVLQNLGAATREDKA